MDKLMKEAVDKAYSFIVAVIDNEERIVDFEEIYKLYLADSSCRSSLLLDIQHFGILYICVVKLLCSQEGV